MAVTGGPAVTLKFKGDKDDLDRTITSLEGSLGRLTTAGIGVGAGIGVLGGLGAAAGAAVLAIGAVPAAFIGIGIAAQAQNAQVQSAFTSLKDHVIASVREMTVPFQSEIVKSLDIVRQAFNAATPDLTRLFATAAPMLTDFTRGIVALGVNALPGFQVAMSASQPIVDAFARGLGTLGTGIGGFFAALSAGTPGATVALDALFGLTKDLLIYLGQLAAQLANALGPAFAELAPVVMEIVRDIGDALMPIIQELAPLIGPLARLIGDLAHVAFAALDAILVPVIHSLRDALGPVIPVITDAFNRMAPVIMQIAEQAGPLLAEIIEALAPLFLTLVQAALDLTEALLPIIPPVLRLAQDLLPPLAGIINDLVIPAVRFMADVMVHAANGLGVLVTAAADAMEPWRHAWTDIRAGFEEAYNAIQAGIDSFAEWGPTVRRHWDAMYQAIKEKIGEIRTAVNAFPEQLHQALAGMATAVVDRGREFITGFWDGAKQVWTSVIDWVKNLPNMVLQAIGDTSRTLYQSGASLIDGFNQGIESKVEASKAAGYSAVDAASTPFPQSPAKEGPFSGGGWTYFRGQSLIDGFVEGIGSMWGKVNSVINSGLGGVSGQINSAMSQIQSAIGGLGLNTASIMNLARNATVGIGPGGAVHASAAGMELRVAPGADGALSSMLMNLVRTGQLQLARA
jgi:phage-related protein